MTRGTGRAQIIRAAVESTAYQCWDVVEAMRADSGQPIASLRADGGASADDFLMQFQADLLECRVERPTCIETPALGAASLAALALGWQTSETLAGRPAASVFTPNMPKTQRTLCSPDGAKPFRVQHTGNRELRRPTPASKTA